MNDTAELARLRTTDLIAVAQAWGYRIDPHESCPSSSVLRCADKKIIVSSKPDGQVYCCPHDPTDCGAVIEFVQHHLAAAGQPSTLGHVRRWLREFGGQSATMQQNGAVGKRIDEPAAPSASLSARWRALATPAPPHPYLTARGLPDSVQGDARWANRIKIDQRGNLCFAHYDQDKQISGWEIKNVAFTGFASGGRKGIWAAGVAEATEIVICESAIDCLSHAALYPDPRRGYISVAGQVSSSQLDLIRLAVGSRAAVIATDADAAGDDLAARIAAALPQSERRRPPAPHKDWNDLLRSAQEDCGVRL